ncbi:hypothetical protein RMATCC62417_07847 [Rhizopus microsporus]|nr:hypothetical protein RMATCC62417_07847 [Rhizopus microsporus]
MTNMLLKELIQNQRDLFAFLEAINSNIEEEEEEEDSKQLTAEEYETEEIRRDIAMMARLQEQRRAYFEEGIIPEDSLGRIYVLDYYDASTSADLIETEGELSCEEESRGRKRKANEDEDDED